MEHWRFKIGQCVHAPRGAKLIEAKNVRKLATSGLRQRPCRTPVLWHDANKHAKTLCEADITARQLGIHDVRALARNHSDTVPTRLGEYIVLNSSAETCEDG